MIRPVCFGFNNGQRPGKTRKRGQRATGDISLDDAQHAPNDPSDVLAEEPTDELLHEWGSALEERLEVQTGSSSSCRRKVVSDQPGAKETSEPENDVPIRSFIDPSNNKIMAQMKSGKTIALGNLMLIYYIFSLTTSIDLSFQIYFRCFQVICQDVTC